MTGGIRLAALLAFAAVSALVAFSSARDAVAIPVPFTPGGVICFEKFDGADVHVSETIRDQNECDGDASPGAATDTRVKFCVGQIYDDECDSVNPRPAETDSNFGGVRGFIPSAAQIKPGDQMPIGALVGYLQADSVLGILGNGCATPVSVNFSLMNASTNIDDTIAPRPIGAADVMQPMSADADGNNIPDGADKYPGFLRSFFDADHDFGPDAIPNTSLDGDGQPASGDDVNGSAAPLKPIARMFGAIRIYQMTVTLNLLVFEPGVTVLGPTREPLTLNADLGYPTAVVLQDPTVPLAPGAISDFCAPLRVRFVTFGLTRDNPCTPPNTIDTGATRGNCPSEGDNIIENAGYPLLPCENGNQLDEDQDGKVNDGCLQVNAVAETGAECDNNISDDPEDSAINDGCPAVGEGENSFQGTGCSGTNEGGCEARKNSPQAGTIKIPIGTQSLRDADEDGIENILDVCALKANPEWNARTIPFDVPNDSDSDGLPNACDPTPNEKSPNSPSGCEKGIVGPDHDQDCYSNRQDNCPTANQLKDPSRPASFTQPPNPPQASDNVPQLFDKDNDGIGDACDVTSCSDKPGYSLADCELFGVTKLGTAADGVGSQDGPYIVDCVTFEITVGPGAPTRATGPTHDLNPGCQTQFGVFEDPTNNPTEDTGGTGGTTGGTGTGTGTGGGVGGPVTGIGSLSPVAGSVPAWATVIGGLGVAGVLGSLGILGSRFVRRRD